MRKEIRRIAAILVAGCLLTGVLCASFAEDTGTPFVSESNTVTIEAAAGELPAVTTETDGTADPAVTEEAAESGDPEEIPEQPETPTVTDAEGYVHFIDNGNTEYREIDDGGGSIEPETVAKLVPEVTEEMKEASGLTGGKPDEEPAAEEPAVRAWITDIRDENNAITLKANAIPSLNGKVIWQIHDRSWPEGTWEEIGNGELLTLDLEEVNDGALVCFLTEDGMISEPYEIRTTAEEEPVTGEPATEGTAGEEPEEEGTAAGEASAETPAEGQPSEDSTETGEAGDGETAGEQDPAQNTETADNAGEDPAAEETADGTDGSEPAADTDTKEKLEPAGLPEGGTAAEGTGEDPAGDGNETPGEEPGEPTTLRAWITGPDNAQAGETVTLNANAEPELTGVSTWQIRNEQVEGGKWKKAGYGDHLTVELAEGDEYRFVMQDGTVSEVLQLCRAPEKAAGEDTGEDGAAEEAGETTGAPAAEEPDEETGDTEEPKETGDTADPGDDPEESGDGAEGTAAEPEGEMSEGTGDTEESGNEPEEPGEGAGETAAEAESEPGGVTGEEETGDAEDSGDEAEGTGDGAEETTAEPEEPTGETGDTADPGDDPEETGDGTEEAAGEPEDEMTGEIGEPEGNEEPGVPEENEENGEAAEPEDGGAADEPEESEEPEEPAEGAEGEGTEESEENSEGEEPEEPAGDGEDAEAEEPAEEPAEERALPENRSAVVSISWDDEHPGIGSVAHFSVLLTGYEELNYTVQWIMSTDNENWTEVEGATGETMDVVVTEDNYLYYWRIRIHIEGFKDVQ